MLAGHPASIYAGGHTHLQLLRRLPEALYLNPGSVGLPLATGEPALWPPPFADYALVEAEVGAISRCAVSPSTPKPSSARPPRAACPARTNGPRSSASASPAATRR